MGMSHNVPAVYDVADQGRQCGEARATEGSEAYTDPLCAVPMCVIKFLDNKLRKPSWIARYYDDGSITNFPGATMGNRVYAYRQEERIKSAIADLKNDEDTLLWVTSTTSYEKTEKGREASWRAVQKQIGPYFRKLCKKGSVDKYIDVKEAHYEGGCHLHAIIRWEGKLPWKKIKVIRNGREKYINVLTDEAKPVEDFITDAWGIGHVDIQVVVDDKAREYLVKELGKAGHVEDALRRAKRNWSKEGDEKFKDRDCKKLWAIYYATKLKIRRVSMSRNIPVADVTENEEPDGDLIDIMNNSTEDKPKPQVIKVEPIPWSIKKQSWFEPYCGKVDPDSDFYKFELEWLKFGEEKYYQPDKLYNALKGAGWK